MNNFNQNNTNRYYKKAVTFHRNKKLGICPKPIVSKFITFSSYRQNEAFTFRNDNVSNDFLICPKKTTLSNHDITQDSMSMNSLKYNNSNIPTYYIPKRKTNNYFSHTSKNKIKKKYSISKIIYIQKFVRSFISNKKVKLMKFIGKIKKIFLCYYIRYIYPILKINNNTNNKTKQVYRNCNKILKNNNKNCFLRKKNSMPLVNRHNRTQSNLNKKYDNILNNKNNANDSNENIIMMPNCPNIHSNKYENIFSNFDNINNNEDEKYKEISRTTEKSNENPENGKLSNRNYINSLKDFKLKESQKLNKDNISTTETMLNSVIKNKNKNKKNNVPICLENSHNPSLGSAKKIKDSKLMSKNLDDSIDCYLMKEEKDVDNKNRDFKKYNNEIIKTFSKDEKSKFLKNDVEKEIIDEKNSFYDENEFVVISYDYNKNNNSTGYSSNTIKCNVEDCSFAFKGFDLIKSEKNYIYNKIDNINNFNEKIKKIFLRNSFNYVFKLFTEIIFDEMNNDKTICDNCSSISSGRITTNGENYEKARLDINPSNSNTGFVYENTTSGANSEKKRNNTIDLNINSYNKNFKMAD